MKTYFSQREETFSIFFQTKYEDGENTFFLVEFQQG